MDEQTAKEREQAGLAAQEIETRLFRLTTMAQQYRQAEARHSREQSGASWQHKEDIGKMYEQENQWFYDRNLFPQWSKDENCFFRANNALEKPQE